MSVREIHRAAGGEGGAASRFSATAVGLAALCVALGVGATAARADDIGALEKRIEAQQRQLDEQRRELGQLVKELKAKQATNNAAILPTKKDLAPPNTLPKSDAVTWNPWPNATMTFYGGLDMGFYAQSTNGNVGSVANYRPTNAWSVAYMGNAGTAPNFGLRGKYDLEGGFSLGLDVAGSLSYNNFSGVTWSPFNKAANLQLGTPFGTFILGEQGDPAWYAAMMGDPRAPRQTQSLLASVWSFGQGTSSPQEDMGPPAALGYTNKFGNLSIGLLYKPYTDAGLSGPFLSSLASDMAIGQQASLGLVYDDGRFFASAGAMEKWGATAAANGVDVRALAAAVGVHVGDLTFKAGWADVLLPYGDVAAPFTAAPLWPNMNTAQDFSVWHGNVVWNVTPKYSADLDYAYTVDSLHSGSGTSLATFGNVYNWDKHIRLFGDIGYEVMGANANIIGAGGSPGNAPAPGTSAIILDTGLRFVW